MNDKFDQLAKVMAQSGTRRTALKKLGIGMGLFALAKLGLSTKAEAAQGEAVQGGNGKKLPGYGEPCKKTGNGYLCQPGLVCHYGQLTLYQHICG